MIVLVDRQNPGLDIFNQLTGPWLENYDWSLLGWKTHTNALGHFVHFVPSVTQPRPYPRTCMVG